MKTTNHNLSAIAMGVALAIGSVSALAANPDNPAAFGLNKASKAERESINPTFEASERTGLALVESSLSLIAARTHIDPVHCAAKEYKLSVMLLIRRGSYDHRSMVTKQYWMPC